MTRALLVEDDRKLSALLVEFLGQNGVEAHPAGDAAAALRALEPKGAAFDIVLLDIMLPEKDGFTVLKELRQRHRDIPVLVMTARNFEADILKGFDKPFIVAVHKVGYKFVEPVAV